jgi:hypothetical protein
MPHQQLPVGFGFRQERARRGLDAMWVLVPGRNTNNCVTSGASRRAAFAT